MENRFVNPHDWLRFAKWAAVCWIVLFWKLGAPALMDPDEAHYAQLTREMLRAGNWMMPLLDGLPYIDKPVLFHWLQGLAIAVLGETETAMRLPSAIAARRALLDDALDRRAVVRRRASACADG